MKRSVTSPIVMPDLIRHPVAVTRKESGVDKALSLAIARTGPRIESGVTAALVVTG